MKILNASTFLFIINSSQGYAADFFVKATAEFKDGSKLELNCERAATGSNKDMKEMFQPSLGNKENSYSLNCLDANKNFFDLFFKYTNSQSADKVEFKPFVSQNKLPLEKQFNVFTVRAKGTDKEMYIHSFPHLPQHYTGQPSLKITSFAEKTDGGSTFHEVGGEGSAEFNETQMDGKSKNMPGKLTWSFKIKAKYIKSPR